MVYSLAILMPPPPPFWMTENEFQSHFSPFQRMIFFHKMAAGGHFGWPIAFLAISDQYSILYFFILFTKWRPFRMTENHFRSHFSPFQINMQLLFWMTENHFRPHCSPFQINTQLFFFLYKMAAAAILDDRKSRLIAFLAISDQYATFIFFEFFFKMAALGSPICTKNNRVLPLCVINDYAKYEVDRWICDTVREMPQAFWAFLYKMATRGHFVFPIDDKNHRVLVSYGLYKRWRAAGTAAAVQP